jgi:hypothetical protein
MPKMLASCEDVSWFHDLNMTMKFTLLSPKFDIVNAILWEALTGICISGYNIHCSFAWVGTYYRF